MRKALAILLVLCGFSGFYCSAASLPYFGNAYSISDVKFAPDGKKIAYTLCATSTTQSGSPSRRCDLFVSSEKKWTHDVSGAFIATDVGTFAWSPDDQDLAYQGACDLEECLFVTDGSKVKNLGSVTGATLQWLTGRVLVATEKGTRVGAPPKSSAPKKGLFVARASEMLALPTSTHANLVLVSVRDGKRQTVEKDVPLVLWRPFVASSPDGRSVAYTIARQFNEAGDVVVDVKLWEDGAKSRVIAGGVTQRPLNGELTWSPDGTKVAWCGGADQRADHSDTISIYDLTSGALVTPNLPSAIKPCPAWRLVFEDLPDLVWEDNSHILISADHHARTSTSDRRATAIYRWDLSSGNVEKVYLGDQDEDIYILGSTYGTPDAAKSLYVLVRPPTGGSSVLAKWSHDTGLEKLDSAIPRGISVLLRVSGNFDKSVYVDSVLDNTPSLMIDDFTNHEKYPIHVAPLTHTNKIVWLDYSIEGRSRTAALVVPPEITSKSKLILAIYPTLTGSDLAAFANLEPFPSLSYWIEHNDFVMYPDMRIRSGRARSDIVEDVKYAIQAFASYKQKAGVKSCGYYVFGHSAGSLATYDLITSDMSLDGAVVTGDFSNWITFFGDGSSESSNMRLYGSRLSEYASIGPTGTPWSNLQGYMAASPYFDFDKVKTPLLIGHGTADPLDSFHAESAFISLESLGKDVTLALADGGGHVLSGWSVEQRNAFLRLVDKFIADHPPHHCN